MDQYLWLIPLGFVIGAGGTLIGAGGGFILMPVLLLLYPDESAEIITSISLAVVFFNTLSGSGAYARMKRIDYKSALLFSAATIPGAILGALTTVFIPRRPFNGIFGIFLIATSIFLLLRPSGGSGKKKSPPKHWLTRNLVEGMALSYLLFQSRPWGRIEPLCRVYFEFAGHRRRHYPRSCPDSPFEFPRPYRHRDFTLCLGGDGFRRDVCAYPDGSIFPRNSAHGILGRRGAHRSTAGSVPF